MVRVGVIGIGYWGTNLSRNLYELGALHAVCDIDENKLNKVKNNYPNVKTFKNFEDMLSEIDACVIATSGGSHYEIAKKALEADKDVYVEKPLTRSAKTSKDLIELAKKKNRILMVGHILLYHPAVRELKKILEDGVLGDVRYIYAQRLNLGRIREDEDALWSLGPHDISVILYLLDEKPTSVLATGESYLIQNFYDVAFITLYFPNKIIANIHVSWLDPHKVRRLTIVGTKKMVVFDDMAQEKIIIYDKGVEPAGDFYTLRMGDIFIPNIKPKEPLKEECKHFLECVESRKEPLTDGENGFEVVKILESAQNSISSHKLVKINY